MFSMLSLLLFLFSSDLAFGNWNSQKTGFIIRHADLKNEQLNDDNQLHLTKFNCPPFPKSNPKPTSVHALRPGDIDIVAAVGDSLTAANGAKASTVVGLLEECRGVAWNMGGEENVNSHASLPNILRQFNPELYGFSTGSGKADSSNAVFNVGNPGDTSYDMFNQAVDLVERMRLSTEIDFHNDWKLITFFIGGNDLCGYCDASEKYSPDNYILNIKNTLDYFQQNLPRTLVNLVTVLDVTGIQVLTGLTCRTMQNLFCKCGLDMNRRDELKKVISDYQTKTKELVSSGRYDGQDDFTVVLQELMKDMTPPLLASGKPDYTYFAPDCFHFSKRGHQAAGTELWNNMLQPVGQKDTKWSTLGETIACPTNDSPFIYTNKNSKKTSILKKLTKN